MCRARTRTLALSWCFWARYAALEYSLIKPWTTCLRLIRAVTSIFWPGSYSGGLLPRLMGPMLVVVPRVLGQDLPDVAFTVDQQVVEALAP